MACDSVKRGNGDCICSPRAPGLEFSVIPFTPCETFLVCGCNKVVNTQGADTLSDSSSVSLEAPEDSRETSVATTVTSDFPTVRSREETDNRSEHSYSESGASCSSFEELDLEASANEGPGGRTPQTSHIGFKVELDSSSKWDKEPLLSEKIRGEE